MSYKANQRLALYRVAAGTILKGARVQILGTTDDKPLNALKPMDRLWVREVLDYLLRDDQQLREATGRVPPKRSPPPILLPPPDLGENCCLSVALLRVWKCGQPQTVSTIT